MASPGEEMQAHHALLAISLPWPKAGEEASSALAREAPELRLVEQRDLVAFLAKALDLHELQPRVLPGGLLRIGPPAHQDGGARRGPAVDDRAGPRRGARRFDARAAENPRERQMNAPQRPQRAIL